MENDKKVFFIFYSASIFLALLLPVELWIGYIFSIVIGLYSLRNMYNGFNSVNFIKFLYLGFFISFNIGIFFTNELIFFNIAKNSIVSALRADVLVEAQALFILFFVVFFVFSDFINRFSPVKLPLAISDAFYQKNASFSFFVSLVSCAAVLSIYILQLTSLFRIAQVLSVITYVYVAYSVRAHGRINIKSILLIGIINLIPFYYGAFALLLQGMLTVFLIFYANRIKIKLSIYLLLIFVSFVFLSLKIEFRILTWGTGLGFFDIIYTWSHLLVDFTSNFQTVIDSSIVLINRASLLIPLAIVIADGFAAVDINYFTHTFWGFVPSLLSGGLKPENTIGQDFGHLVQTIAVDDYSTSVNVPYLVQAYIGSGYTGLILYACLLSLLLRFHRDLFLLQRSSAVQRDIGVILFPTFFQLIDNNGMLLGGIMVNFAFIMVLFFILFGFRKV